jgi:hypothetical protein
VEKKYHKVIKMSSIQTYQLTVQKKYQVNQVISSTGSFVTSVVGSPSPTFSPVNGLIVVGVVVVLTN